MIDSDTRLVWDFGIDLTDFKRDMASVGTELRKVDQSIVQFARDANQGLGAVVDEVKALNLAFQTVRGQGAQVGREINTVFNSIQRQAEAVDKAVRQNGMGQAAKAADNYAAAITKATAQVEVLKQKLAAANIEEKRKLELQAKIAQGEQLIADLTAKSKVRVEQVRRAEQERLQTIKTSASGVRQALQDLALGAGIVGAALTAGIGGAVKEFGDFEAQIIKFGAVSGATADEIAKIEQQALSLGASTKYTAREIAAAQVELAKMGFSASETADAMEAMVNAAIASGEDLGQVSSTIAATIRMFNLQASDAGKVADIITRGANISAQSFTSYADSMRYVGAAANGLNQDLVTVGAALNMLADRQIKGTQAGEHLKIALNRLATQPKPAADAIRELNLAIADTMGTADKSDDKFRNFFEIIKDIKREFADKGYNSIEQTGFLKKLFGAEAVASMRIFVDATEETIDAAIKKQNEYGGAVNDTAEKMKQGWNYAVEEMKGAINSLQISLGKELAPTLLMLAKGVKAVADGFNAMPDPIKSVIGHFGLLLAAGAAALTGAAGLSMMTAAAGKGVLTLDGLVGGKLVSSLGGLGNTVKGILPVIGRGFTALATGPVGVLIAAATALWLAYKTNLGNLRYHVDEFMGFMAEAWGPSMSEIVEGSKDTWAGFQQFMKGVFQWVSEGFLTVLGVADSFFNALMRIVSATGRLIPGIIDAWEKKDWGLLKSTIDELGNATEDLAAAMNPEQIMRNAERYREMAFKKFFDHEKKLEELKKKTQDTEKKTNHIADTGLNTQVKKLDLLDAELAKQKELLNNERKRVKLGESTAQTAGPTHRVFDPNIAGAPTNSPYGMRRSGMHRGNDSAQAAGRPILSQDAGVVAHVGDHGNQSWGKFIVVDNGDGTYWLYGHSSKIYAQINDRVEKKQRLALVGNTGRSFGSHIHTELRVGKPGLRGEGVIAGTKPINPNIGKETKGHDHAADAVAAETDYFSKLIRLLEQYKAAYQRVMVSLKGEERTEAEGRVRQLEGEILDARQQVKDLGLDLAKAQAESAEAALESVREAISDNLKEIETAFGESVKAIEDHAEEGKKRFYAKLEKSDPQALANSFGEMQTWYSEAQATVEGLAAAVADAKQDISLMGPEERKQLQALEELLRKAEVQAGRTAYQLREMYGSQEPYTTLGAPGAPNVRLRTGRPGTKTTEDSQLDFDQLWENMDRAADKGREFRDKMLANQEAMDLFSNAINSNAVDLKQLAKALGLSREEMAGFGLTLGTVDLDEFQKRLNLTDEQIAELAKALGDEDGLAIVERIFNRGTEETRKFNKTLDETQSYVSSVISVFKDLVNLLPESLAELRQVGNELANMMDGVSSGALKVAESIKTSDPMGAITGLMQSGMQYWSFVLAQFGKLGDAVKRITDETKQLRREARDLQLDTQEAALEGKTDSASQQTLAVMRKRRQLLPYADAYEDDFGMAIPVDPTTGDFDPDAMEAYVNRKFQGNDRQRRLNALMAFKNQIIRVNGELQRELVDMAAESAGQVAASVDAAQAYWDNLNREEASANDVAHLLDLSAGMDPKLREALRSTAEQIIAERNRITEEVIEGNQGPEELARRLAKFQLEAERMMGDALLAAQKETLDAAARAQQEAFEAQQKAQEEALRRQQEAIAAQQQRIRDAEDELRGRSNALKDARTEIYDADVKTIEAAIAGAEQELKLIEQANKALQDKIDLKNKALEADLKTFDANDLGIFAQKKADVDYDAEVRLGLEDIHNPEGVLTGTYSQQSIEEAIKARVELATLENENKFGLELYDAENAQKNREAYLLEVQAIAAIEARAAEEALETEGLTSRQKQELMRMSREAYRRFQEAYREQLTLNAEAEIESLQQQIEVNEAGAQSHHDTIESKRVDLATLRATYEADIQIIEDRIAEVLDAHAEWKISTEQLRDGVKGPLDAMVKDYLSVKTSAEAASKAIREAAAAQANNPTAPANGATAANGATGAGGTVKPPPRVKGGNEKWKYAGVNGWWYKSSADRKAGDAYEIAHGGVKSSAAQTIAKQAGIGGSADPSKFNTAGTESIITSVAGVSVVPHGQRGAIGTSWTQDLESIQWPAYASGGVVPPGFPNDTYYARLSSNEPVFPGPKPLQDWMDKNLKLNLGPAFDALIARITSPLLMGGSSVVYNNQRGPVTIQINGGDIQEVRRVIRAELGGGINTNVAYNAPLGL